MIFDVLNESNQRGELLLVDGGMCHWHLRRSCGSIMRAWRQYERE